MSVSITIAGTVIEFPESGASPDWAPAIIEFAQAVETALSGVVGEFDVPPQVMTIDAYNPGTDIDIPNLSFPIADVRAANIVYSVFRTTSSDTVVETGDLQIVYNPDGPTNNKWEISKQSTGDASITFSVTDIGQVTFTTASIAGTSHEGRLTYTAKALLQD